MKRPKKNPSEFKIFILQTRTQIIFEHFIKRQTYNLFCKKTKRCNTCYLESACKLKNNNDYIETGKMNKNFR